MGDGVATGGDHHVAWLETPTHRYQRVTRALDRVRRIEEGGLAPRRRASTTRASGATAGEVSVDVILSFAALRPVDPATPPPLPLATDTDFQQGLAAADRAQATALAQAFAESGFVHSADDVQYGGRIESVLGPHRGGELPDPDALASEL